MTRALVVAADLTFEHGEIRVRLVGRGRRLRVELPSVGAALALTRAGAASLLRSARWAAVHSASDVELEIHLGRTCVGRVRPDHRTNLTARLLGLRSVVVHPLRLALAMLRGGGG